MYRHALDVSTEPSRLHHVRPPNPPSMRIVAWNCCRGPLEKKLAALERLSPDVAVLSEAPRPLEESDQVLWFPSGVSSLGIQVRASGKYQVKRLPCADLPNCVVPVRVIGPTSFNLLAVWTWPAPSYVKALLNGLTAYAQLLNSNETVIAGDFNGSPALDKPGTRIRWSTAFDMLQDAGSVSAYHHRHAVPFGSEAHSTYHHLRKPGDPFHIDFCFVPRLWTEKKFEVEVIADPEWSSLSDHFPILVAAEV